MPGSAGSRRTEHGGGRRRRKLKAPCPILYGRGEAPQNHRECGLRAQSCGGIRSRSCSRRNSGPGNWEGLEEYRKRRISAALCGKCSWLPNSPGKLCHGSSYRSSHRSCAGTSMDLAGDAGQKTPSERAWRQVPGERGGTTRTKRSERKVQGGEPVPSVRRSATAKRGRNRRTVFTAQPPDGQPQGGVKSAGGTGMGGRLRERRESGDRNAGA